MSRRSCWRRCLYRSGRKPGSRPPVGPPPSQSPATLACTSPARQTSTAPSSTDGAWPLNVVFLAQGVEKPFEASPGAVRLDSSDAPWTQGKPLITGPEDRLDPPAGPERFQLGAAIVQTMLFTSFRVSPASRTRTPARNWGGRSSTTGSRRQRASSIRTGMMATSSSPTTSRTRWEERCTRISPARIRNSVT